MYAVKLPFRSGVDGDFLSADASYTITKERIGMAESLPTESELPNALTTRDQWLCWRTEDRDGKMTKVPIDPTSGTFA